MWAGHTDDPVKPSPAGKNGVPSGAVSRPAAPRSLSRLATRRRAAALRHRGGDRRHEPRGNRGLAARNALSQHRRRLVAGIDRSFRPARAAARRNPAVAATDNNSQGDIFAERLRALAADAGAGFERLRPGIEDWNEVLQAKDEKEEERERKRMAAACPPSASRVKLRPADAGP